MYKQRLLALLCIWNVTEILNDQRQCISLEVQQLVTVKINILSLFNIFYTR